MSEGLVGRLRAGGCVFAEEEAALLRAEAGADEEQLETLVARRLAGEPLEHVLGWAVLGDRRVHVGPGVFVPRRSSEALVDAAVRALRRPGASSRPVVVDLCCGSGAVGSVIADRLPAAEVHAADLDPAAVACARRNLPPDRVHRGDLWAALPDALRGGVDVVVCHPPYVPSDQLGLLPREARLHERAASLDGGPDGLGVVRRVLAEASTWLADEGVLLLETSEAAEDATLSAVGQAGLVARLEEGAAGGLVVVVQPIRPDRPGVAE